MLSKVRSRMTYANVVSSLCLFLVLSGGTAVALSGKNTVFSDDIKDGQVKNADIAGSAVRASKVKDGSLTGKEIKPDSISGKRIDESSLGKVPSAHGADAALAAGFAANADKLDNVDSSAFARSACPSGMVKVGPTCIDRYEDSLWTSPTGGTEITGPVPCNANGQDCSNIYARSVPGVKPAAHITWFQAQQALVNSGKRLPNNAEWQAAVAGTPDSTACNVSTGSVQNTGAGAGCVSRFGAFDMVGNVWEWVADWGDQAAGCATWPSGFGSDSSCVGLGEGETNSRFPGALIRGGNWVFGTAAGAFAVYARYQPSDSSSDIGFRGAR